MLNKFLFLSVLFLFANCTFSEVYNNVGVQIGHDPVTYTIDRYALYENCFELNSEGKVLVGAVTSTATVTMDLPLIANLGFCVSAIVKDSNDTDVIGEPFAFYELNWMDVPAPQNGTLNIDITCKYPACTKIEITN